MLDLRNLGDTVPTGSSSERAARQVRCYPNLSESVRQCLPGELCT